MWKWAEKHKIFITIIGIVTTVVINFFTQKHFNIGIDLKLILGEIDLSTLIIMVLIICAIVCFYKSFTQEDGDWGVGGVLYIVFALIIIFCDGLAQNTKEAQNNFTNCVQSTYKEKSDKTLQDIKEYCTLMYRDNN